VSKKYRKRIKTRSKITGCSVRFAFNQEKSNGVYYLQVLCEQYNHPSSLRPLDHAAYRRVKRKEDLRIIQKIQSDLIIRIPPKKTLDSLKHIYLEVLLKI
jgi:hypothetical protein